MKKLQKRGAQNFRQDPAVYLAPPVLKESFQRVYELLQKEKTTNVIDIGCASGDFLYYLPENMIGLGIDASASLIRVARKRVRKKQVRFLQADALTLTQADTRHGKGARPAVTLLGILHTFLDFRPLIDAALKFNPRLIIVHSPFSEEPVDSYHYHRLAENPREPYQCGYSFFSMQTVKSYLTARGLKNYRFVPFLMKRRLKKDAHNPLRNYHVRDSNGNVFLTNGIHLLFKEYFLIIKPS